MLANLYRSRWKLPVSNQDTMIKEKWCMPPLEGTFFQIVNMNGNHWVLLTNLHQKDPDCVLAYDSFYGRGKADSTDFAEIGAYDQSLLSAVKQLRPMARTLRIAKTEPSAAQRPLTRSTPI